MVKNKEVILGEEDSGENLKKIIGAKIKRARRRLDRSAIWVAEQAGTTRGALTQIENGKNNITAAMLWKIASVLKCDIKEFFPDVPESSTLTATDLKVLALENAQAAEFTKKAFKLNK